MCSQPARVCGHGSSLPYRVTTSCFPLCGPSVPTGQQPTLFCQPYCGVCRRLPRTVAAAGLWFKPWERGWHSPNAEPQEEHHWPWNLLYLNLPREYQLVLQPVFTCVYTNRQPSRSILLPPVSTYDYQSSTKLMYQQHLLKN